MRYTRGDRSGTLIERFWRKTKIVGSCFIWTAGTMRGGYAAFTVDGRKVQGHRWIYEYTHGPVGADLVVRHTCDTPNCVNPDHLITGTQLDNMQDAKARGRLQKISDATAAKVRGLILLGVPYRSISKELGVSLGQISKLRSQK